MTDEKEQFANLQQQFGDLYQYSDHKRGEHITYSSFDGTIKQGTIIWVQEPGETVRSHKHLVAQYVIEPDDPAGTMGFEFVPLGDVRE